MGLVKDVCDWGVKGKRGMLYLRLRFSEAVQRRNVRWPTSGLLSLGFVPVNMSSEDW